MKRIALLICLLASPAYAGDFDQGYNNGYNGIGATPDASSEYGNGYRQGEYVPT